MSSSKFKLGNNVMADERMFQFLGYELRAPRKMFSRLFLARKHINSDLRRFYVRPVISKRDRPIILTLDTLNILDTKHATDIAVGLMTVFVARCILIKTSQSIMFSSRILRSIAVTAQVTFVACLLVLGSNHRGSLGIAGAASIEGDGTRSHLRHAADDSSTRELFDLPHPFDFYNDACASSCGSDGEDLVPFLNACPKCPDKYEAQHCNHCCLGGASSLKLRWHGCPGRVRFASPTQGFDDCAMGADEMLTQASLRFVDCDCYDTKVANAMAGQDTMPTCLLRTSITVRSPNDYAADICIVSVSAADDGTLSIGLSKPLPPIIGLVHDTTENIDSSSAFWVPYPLTTYFDTTCDLIDDSSLPFVLPIFPGYGKFPNTCPTDGLIDLQRDGYPELPDPIDHYDGEPPAESFWYEFVDGTSTAFWPLDEGADDDGSSVYFDPTFGTCACRECTDAPTPRNPGPPAPETSPSTSMPSQGRNPGPGAPPTQSPKTSAPYSPKGSKTTAPHGKGKGASKTSSPKSARTPDPSTVPPTPNPSDGRNPGPGLPQTNAPSTTSKTSAPHGQGKGASKTSGPKSTQTSAPSTDGPTPSPSEGRNPGPGVPQTNAPSSKTTVPPTAMPSKGRNPGPGATPTQSSKTSAPSTPKGVKTTAPHGKGKGASKTSAPKSASTSAPSTAAPTPSPSEGRNPGPGAPPTEGPSKELTTASPSCSRKSPKTNAPSPAPVTKGLKTSSPTMSPTAAPSQARNPGPGFQTPGPTPNPISAPTEVPTVLPTESPTSMPTGGPTRSPTVLPTESPTSMPTGGPTRSLTAALTPMPTPAPTRLLTAMPTVSPTPLPTTAAPTGVPTTAPTASPTPLPTVAPTGVPTSEPSSGRNPGSANCPLTEYATCFGFAFTQCSTKASAPAYDAVCEYNPNGRRKLEVIKSFVDEASKGGPTLKALKQIITKESVERELRRHVEASAKIAAGSAA